MSKVLSEETLGLARDRIKNYQHAGRCGTAYLLKCYHLQHFENQFTQEDRDQLQELAAEFTQLLRNTVWSALYQKAIEPFGFTFLESLLLPHEDLLIKYRISGQDRYNASLEWHEPHPFETRVDFLGRSISQVFFDNGSRKPWRDVDINRSDFLGRTAIYQACNKEVFDDVEMLLQKGADPLKPNVLGVTQLHVAASRGLDYICARICEFAKVWTPSINFQDFTDCTSRTPIMCAASEGHLSTVEMFCNDMLNPPRTYQLASALQEVVSDRQLYIVRSFINYGRRFNMSGNDLHAQETLSIAKKRRFETIEAELSDFLGIVPLTEQVDEVPTLGQSRPENEIPDERRRTFFLENLRAQEAMLSRPQQLSRPNEFMF